MGNQSNLPDDCVTVDDEGVGLDDTNKTDTKGADNDRQSRNSRHRSLHPEADSEDDLSFEKITKPFTRGTDDTRKFSERYEECLNKYADFELNNPTIRKALNAEQLATLRDQVIGDCRSDGELEAILSESFRDINDHFNHTISGDSPPHPYEQGRLDALKFLDLNFRRTPTGNTCATLSSRSLSNDKYSTQRSLIKQPPRAQGPTYYTGPGSISNAHFTHGNVVFGGSRTEADEEHQVCEEVFEGKITDLKQKSHEQATWEVTMQPIKVRNLEFRKLIEDTELAGIPELASNLTDIHVLDLSRHHLALKNDHYFEWSKDKRMSAQGAKTGEDPRYEQLYGNFWSQLSKKDMSKVGSAVEPVVQENCESQLRNIVKSKTRNGSSGAGSIQNLRLETKIDPSRMSQSFVRRNNNGNPVYESLFDKDWATFTIVAPENDQTLLGVNPPRTQRLSDLGVDINDTQYDKKKRG